ncbi:DUF2971 domain-containing protein [Pseudoalteromonas sp. SSM20]|uniref:DUF2971 domain-containing protein n=1 Tax=Pseudoalteromonas sp. SSM20 TaxID=3139394 RepID=UPI003BA8CF2C
MNLHHYTTLETLALILESKKIRFNRLTNVDDVQESENFGRYDLSPFIYISCWTLSPEESIPLWKMYTSNMKGVRITFDGDPFHYRKPEVSDLPELNIELDENLLSPLTFKQMMSPSYFILPSFLSKDQFGKKVEYVDDVTGIYENSVAIQVEPDGKAHMTMPGAGNVAIHKNKIWKFQEEFRYSLIAFPPPTGGYSNENIPEISNVAINSIYHGKKTEVDYIDLDMCPEKLENMTITLGPLATYADEIILKALVSKYCPNANIKNSNLQGKIR